MQSCGIVSLGRRLTSKNTISRETNSKGMGSEVRTEQNCADDLITNVMYEEEPSLQRTKNESSQIDGRITVHYMAVSHRTSHFYIVGR
jgi:hypothetical protein